jgi:nucleotide-binding universal stress UspA family protein
MAASSAPTAAGTPLLVLGDDGSPSAESAWSWVLAQPWQGWALEVVTVVPVPLPDAEARGETEPEPVGRRTPPEELGFASSAHVVVQGDSREVLTGMTEADLVVIGPRGKSPLERLLVGSTANALLTAPPSPVLVVRTRGPVRRVIACTDGSPHAAAAIRALAALPLAASASVTVLGVHDDRSPVDEGLAKARSILAEAGIDATTQTEEGMVPGIVLREIDELGADLVVLGTRGLTGLRRLWLGSTASAIAQSAPCSVLVASADD